MEYITVKIRNLVSYMPWMAHLLYYRVHDPCRDAAAGDVVAYAAALQCYNSFPLVYEVESSTLETLTRSSYLDVRRRDLSMKLARVRQRHHRTAHAFQRELMTLYNRLSDQHYTYTSQCYTAFEFVHPFPLEMVNDEFYVANISHHPRLSAEWAKMGLDLEGFKGSRVVAIDGVAPEKYLATFADNHVGTTPDPHARLALVLSRAKLQDGHWAMDVGSFARTRIAPASAALTITLVQLNNTLQLRVPYLALSPNNFASRAAFYLHNCLTPRNVSQAFLPSPAQPSTARVIGLGKVSAHLVAEGGILRIGELGSADPMAQLGNAVIALKMLRKRNATRLILDLSDAGGSGVCVVRLLLRSLFNTDLHVLSHLRHSPLLKLVMDNVPKHPLVNINRYTTSDGAAISNISFLKSKHHYSARIRFFTAYTPPLLDACPYQTSFLPDLVPREVAVITNGLCFGACALLVAKLSTIPTVATFKTSSSFNTPTSLASGPDVERVEIQTIIDALAPAKQKAADLLPRRFATVAQLHIPAREFIQSNVGFPVRFQEILAQSRILHHATAPPTGAWRDILKWLL